MNKKAFILAAALAISACSAAETPVTEDTSNVEVVEEVEGDDTVVAVEE